MILCFLNTFIVLHSKRYYIQFEAQKGKEGKRKNACAEQKKTLYERVLLLLLFKGKDLNYYCWDNDLFVLFNNNNNKEIREETFYSCHFLMYSCAGQN